ncbi:alkaline-phosphatase-like protein [Blastocladiella britannica]|nr:alkaline-phosphatase-like protein [Blastocladiella britannica]
MGWLGTSSSMILNDGDGDDENESQLDLETGKLLSLNLVPLSALRGSHRNSSSPSYGGSHHRRRWRRRTLWRIVVSLAATVAGAVSLGIYLRNSRRSARHSLNTPDASHRPLTILVSLDGFRASYLDLGLTPTLRSLYTSHQNTTRIGLRASSLIPSFPSVTFPNHYTLATGQWPAQHGIVSNAFWAPDVSAPFLYTDPASNRNPEFWRAATPVWVAAERQNVSSAVMAWPGSEAEHVNASSPVRRPGRWTHYRDMPAARRVNLIMTWLDPRNATGLVGSDLPDADSDDWPGWPGYKREQWPASAPPVDPAPPDFVALYIPDVDKAGHAYGPDSPQVAAALVAVDTQLARLIELLRASGRWDATNLVIVSDHGMTKALSESDVEHGDFVDGVVMGAVDLSKLPLDTRRISLSQSLGTFRNVSMIRDRWPVVLLEPKELSDVPAIFATLAKNAVHYTPYAQGISDIPTGMRYSDNLRIPPIVVVPDPGFQFEDLAGEPLPIGMHGYDVDSDDMRAIFIASGPLVANSTGLFEKNREHVVPAFANVEVYAIVCKALGIRPDWHAGTGVSWLT